MSKKGESGRPLRVVIADDHATVRQALRAMLAGPDIEIAGEAADGVAAVETVRALRPDIVLMDVQMPGMDGLEATVLIRQESPATQVVIVTNYENHSYLRRAIEAGASGYVLKGSSRAAFIDAIRLAGGSASAVSNRALKRLADEARKRRTPSPGDLVRALSPLEQRVLWLIADDRSNTRIADELGTSAAAVRIIVQSIFDRLGVTDRSAAAAIALRARLEAEDAISDAAGS